MLKVGLWAEWATFYYNLTWTLLFSLPFGFEEVTTFIAKAVHQLTFASLLGKLQSKADDLMFVQY